MHTKKKYKKKGVILLIRSTLTTNFKLTSFTLDTPIACFCKCTVHSNNKVYPMDRVVKPIRNKSTSVS